MTLELTRHCFTTAKYDRMIEAGILDEDDRVELIEGEIVEMTPIGSVHVARVNRCIPVLTAIFGRNAQLSVQNPIHLGDASEPQPDVTFLRPQADYYASALPTAADILLLVEVSDSSLAFDRQIKIPLYARHGVAEVWLIDVAEDLITVYRDPTPSGYATVHDVSRGGTLSVLAFPGCEIAAADLLG